MKGNFSRNLSQLKRMLVWREKKIERARLKFGEANLLIYENECDALEWAIDVLEKLRAYRDEHGMPEGFNSPSATKEP